jgi:Putative prokaryotic signal transducing protein
MYRKPEMPRGKGALVTFRNYTDPVEAQIARARLSAEGIEAHVLGEGLHNVIMPGSISGIRLQVAEGDVVRVEEILRERPGEGARDDGEGGGVVRCPRCELAYCFHEKMRTEGNSAGTAIIFLAAVIMVFVPKRWHCHRCGHVWSDPKEGPAEMTKLEAGDPHPVFRLRRTHAGMGLFLGLVAGGFTGMIAASLPRDLRWIGPIAFCVAPLLGWIAGRVWRYDLCSDPACRTPLAADREDCPRCGGAIAGVVRSADQHYAAAADFRRDLKALRAKDAAPRLKKKKKAAAALPQSAAPRDGREL